MSNWPFAIRSGSARPLVESGSSVRIAPSFFVLLLSLLYLGLALSPPALAQAAADPAPSDTGGGGAPGLESLLRLPDSYQAGGGERKGGATEQEWRKRFLENQTALDTARADVARAKAELEGAAADGGNFNVAPPGAQAEPGNTPISFKLLQEIRNGREQIETLERAKRQLEIEADLAGVPQTWRN